MSNLVEKNPHVHDTASSSAVMTGSIRVKRLRWVGATTAGHVAEVQDKDGRILWRSMANGANYTDESNLDTVWPDGYKVPTLQSGTLFVYFG